MTHGRGWFMKAPEQLRSALEDRYRLDRELGQGGMATVYLAHDLKHDRDVALKVLRPELAATLGSDRFLREVQVAARLQHPHILPLLDSGEAAGFFYYVMPYVAGESLRERLARSGELPVHEAVKLLIEVVDALAAAHALGVVHRDIKPDNVMLSGRHALVMDFGVAKAVSEATGRNQLTTAGVALGTPAYMAPEQAAAEPTLDHRVDIYAVGIMGYELLTGQPPFGGGTAQQVLAAHVTRPPEPITSRRPSIPAALAAVIMKCLEKRPADRWQTAEELLHQLEPLATPSGGMTPTQTRPVEAVSVRPGSMRRWAVAAILVAGALAGGAFVLKQRGKHSPVTLRDRTQLTSTGRVSLPAISSDGKQLAYVVTDCGGGRCTFGIELRDVGGSATRRLLDGATGLYALEWSPDRRNLLFGGTVTGRYGVYLISALGGKPQYITPQGATFFAGGDSLLVMPILGPDSVFWLGVAGLDGIVRDSIRISGPAQGLRLGEAVPGSPWVTVVLLHSPENEWRAINRQGQEGGRVRIVTTGGINRNSSDAVWISSNLSPNGSSIGIIRIPFDPRTGRFAAQWDTVYTGLGVSFDVTADGHALMVAEGSAEFSAWELDLTDALRGHFSEADRLLQSTTPLRVAVNPTGNRVLILRSGATGKPDQLSVAPYGGSTEMSIRLEGGLRGWSWGPDSVTVGLAERIPTGGRRLVRVDVRSGARESVLATPDSLLADWAPLPDGGWAWMPSFASILRLQHRGESAPRDFPLGAWYQGVTMGMAQDGERFVVTAWTSASDDSLGVGVLSTSDGSFTPWATVAVEGGTARILPDGSILVQAYETSQTVTLYRLRGPGRMKRLGTIPRAVTTMDVANDLHRATVVTRGRRFSVAET
jgi:tRNA A-37 threonylcarbamoyl transferase component Bud32